MVAMNWIETLASIFSKRKSYRGLRHKNDVFQPFFEISTTHVVS